MAKSIIVCGARGTGKTTYVRKLVSAVHPQARLIFDVNNEYSDLYNKPFTQFEEFSKQATRIKSGLIVFEEATIFLTHSGSVREIREILVKARHTKNTIVFVFHSLRSIPRYLFDLCNYVVLFKTSDIAELVEKKFENPHFTQVFNEIQSAPWLKAKGTDKKFSPHKVFEII